MTDWKADRLITRSFPSPLRLTVLTTEQQVQEECI